MVSLRIVSQQAQKGVPRRIELLQLAVRADQLGHHLPLHPHAFFVPHCLLVVLDRFLELALPRQLVGRRLGRRRVAADLDDAFGGNRLLHSHLVADRQLAARKIDDLARHGGLNRRLLGGLVDDRIRSDGALCGRANNQDGEEGSRHKRLSGKAFTGPADA